MEYKFKNTRLLVKNFKECFLFYRDVLGYQPTWGDENNVYASFDTGAVSLDLFARTLESDAIGTANLPVEAAAQDRTCIVLGVEDVDQAYHELKARGAAMIDIQPADHPEWGMRCAWLRDPDGNLIEIFKPLEQTS